MGYEIKLIYCEKVEDEYDKTNKKEIIKKLGSSVDDISLEKLAAFLMMQMARRDIFVIDAEVFEFKKSKISFKETKGGIVLKNKKFLFDGGGTEGSTIIVEDMMQAAPPAPIQQVVAYNGNGAGDNPNVNIVARVPEHPHNNGNRRPIDYMVFSPELPDMPEVKRKNIRFTTDKKYPIYDKKPSPLGTAFGEVFAMVDDTGREQLVSDKYFIPGNTELFADRELKFTESPQQRDGGTLYWGGANKEPDMPDIRRR